jgi:WD40 repeat protein
MLNGKFNIIRTIDDSSVTNFSILNHFNDHKIYILTSHKTGNITIRDFESLVDTCELTESTKPLYAISVKFDSTEFCAGGVDGKIYRYQSEKDGLATFIDLVGSSEGVMCIIKVLSYHPEGQILACGGDNGEIYFFDIDKDTILFKLSNDMTMISSIDFDPLGHFLISMYQNGIVIVWNLSKIESCFMSKKSVNDLHCFDIKESKFLTSRLCWYAHGTTFVHSGPNSLLYIYQRNNWSDVRTFKILEKSYALKDVTGPIAISLNGIFLAVVYNHGNITIFLD